MIDSLSPFAFGTADDFNDVRECVPPTLKALAAKSHALLGLEPRIVAAVGLAHIAASLGRSILLDDGRVRMSACFNLAVVSEELPARDWAVSLGRGWADSATQLQAMHTPELQEQIRNCVRDAGTKRTDRNIDPQFESYMKDIPLKMANMLRLRAITSKVDPDAIARAIVDSRDHCVLMVNGADDPMAEWAQLSPAKQQRIATQLKLSWQCKSLAVTPAGAELPGSVHLLWQTNREEVHKMMFNRKKPPLCRSVPMLLLENRSEPKRLPEVNATEFQEWSQLLKSLSNYRSRPIFQSELVLAKPDHLIVDEFFLQFDNALVKQPEAMKPYLAWLPDLVLRLVPAIVMAKALNALNRQNTVGNTENEQPPTMPENASPNTTLEAVRLTRWLCQEHYRTVCSYLAVKSADSPQVPTDNTDTERLEEDILQRLKDNGPQTPRELQRCFHELPAKIRDEVLMRLKSKGVVIQDLDGKLEVAA